MGVKEFFSNLFKKIDESLKEKADSKGSCCTSSLSQKEDGKGCCGSSKEANKEPKKEEKKGCCGSGSDNGGSSCCS